MAPPIANIESHHQVSFNGVQKEKNQTLKANKDCLEVSDILCSIHFWVVGWALVPCTCSSPRLSTQNSPAAPGMSMALGWRGGVEDRGIVGDCRPPLGPESPTSLGRSLGDFWPWKASATISKQSQESGV